MCNGVAAFACGAIKNRVYVYAVFTKQLLVNTSAVGQKYITAAHGFGVVFRLKSCTQTRVKKFIFWNASYKMRGYFMNGCD
jgi:hypothetical protein